jgi:DNA-binding NtrC family response regulator
MSSDPMLGEQGTHVVKSWKVTREIPGAPTVLVAATDAPVRSGLGSVLPSFAINTAWVTNLADASDSLAAKSISACLCGFWLEDNTYRDLMRLVKHLSPNLPVIVASTPACPDEYHVYLEAMNLGAFEFLCYPYRRPDLARVLRQAITAHQRDSWHPSLAALRAAS